MTHKVLSTYDHLRQAVNFKAAITSYQQQFEPCDHPLSCDHQRPAPIRQLRSPCQPRSPTTRLPDSLYPRFSYTWSVYFFAVFNNASNCITSTATWPYERRPRERSNHANNFLEFIFLQPEKMPTGEQNLELRGRVSHERLPPVQCQNICNKDLLRFENSDWGRLWNDCHRSGQ